MLRKKMFWLLCLLAGLIFLVRFCLASDSQLAISEIMYDPLETDDKKEWLELVNVSGQELTFLAQSTYKGKYVMPFRVCSKIDSQKSSCLTSAPVYFEENSLLIDSEEFLVIVQDKISFKNQYPDYQGKILESSFSLTNKTEENFVGLYQVENSQPNWQDQLSYANSWGGAGNGRSLEKIDLLKANEKNNWQESTGSGGSPGTLADFQEIVYSEKIVINEIFADPVGADQDQEWIELHNLDDQPLPLYGWSLKDKSGKQYFFSQEVISPQEFLMISYQKSRIVLNNDSDEIFLLNPQGTVVSQIAYGQAKESGWAWARKENGQFAWTTLVTPNQANKFSDPAADNTVANISQSYPDTVKFNEILPNPKSEDRDREWIELKNFSAEKVDLANWKIINSAKKEYRIKNQEVLGLATAVISLKKTTFSLKNSQEQLQLVAPNGQRIDEVKFSDSAKEDLSYNKTESGNWKWSKFLTPGRENQFNSLPSYQVDCPKKAFVGLPVQFGVTDLRDQDDDELKISWDFGDKHKSSQKNATHTYEKKGSYKIMLSVDDGSEKIQQKFSLKVETLPKEKLKIIRLLPNPAGMDSQGAEKVEIENQGKKEVDLKGYRIATGKDRQNLAGHLIESSLLIQPGQSELLDNSFCKFSLLNNSGAVAIKAPNNEIIDWVQYGKDSVQEDEEYYLEDGKWQWFSPKGQEEQMQPTEAQSESLNPQAEDFSVEEMVDAVVLAAESSVQAQIDVPAPGGGYLNEKDGRCENPKQRKIENWKDKNNPWIKWAGELE